MTTPTILITGASRGLGAAAARYAAQLGASVVLNARTADALAAVAEDIHALGGKALAVPGDVGRAEDCQQLVVAALDRFGYLDAIVNNAGIIEPIAPIAKADLMAWKVNLEINLFGPVMLIQASLPYLRERSGRVINVSTGAAVSVHPGWSAYSAAKAALNQFNRILADEEPAITAITFRPGAVDTQMQILIRQEGAVGMSVQDYARFLRMHQEGELLPPELPGRALAVLALYAPHQWSGSFLSWDDNQVQELVKRYQ